MLRKIPSGLLELQDGSRHISKRVDVIDTVNDEREVFYWGFDLFIVNGADLAYVPRLNMIFGMPRWGYVLPLGLLRVGKNISRLSEPLAIHLIHLIDRPEELWLKIG